ncbi:MAG: GAF domain-containing protein, partial [Proteobacteria bacterium]|nr:GAF domain-containing protein [Pseudomonadota bacterium]
MVFLALINNVALALALTIVLGLLWRKRSYEDLPAQVLAGLLFGGVAVVAMMNPLRFAPGIVFDTRSIVVSLAGLCAGPVTAILSAAAAAAYRLALGGIGAWTGIGTIVTSAAIGVAFFYLVPRARSTRPVFLLLFGFVVHIFVLAWMLTLPWAQAWLVLQKISWPMLTLYPVGTLLMGLLLAAQYRHHRAELALSASEKQYRNLAESINDVFFALDRDLRYTYWNRASEELTGIPAKKAVGKTLYQIFPDVRGTKIEDKYLEALRTDRPVFFENEYQVAGQDHVFAISAYPTADGLTVFTKDITERHLHENTLIHLNRILRLQSACNQVLVTAREESDLFEEICRLIVDQGGYKFAWVGLAETDEARTVRLAASFGLEEGYLDQVNITWADTECGRGPTGTAIRTGEPVVCREVESNGSYGPWREEALRRGFASSVALLLEGEGRVFGALNIYADEPDAFDEEEMRLLSEMAADLAYGVTALRTGVLRLKAEREVLMYQGLINQSSDAKYVTDRATGKILYVNDQACQDLDYTRDELLRMNVKDIDPTIPDEAARQKKFVQVLEKDCRLRIES